MAREALAPAMWVPRFTRFETSAAPRGERVDYWRALFPLLELEPLGKSTAGYDSTIVACAGDDNTVFARITSDPTDTHFVADCNERVMLNLFVEGGAHVRHGNGREDAMAAGGGFSLIDCARTTRTVARERHESLHLSLPRSRVLDVLGPSPAGEGASFRTLPDTPLGQLLKANMMALAQFGATLDTTSAAIAMDAVSNLAMGYLAQFRPEPSNPGDGVDIDRHRFEAACHYIDAHLDDQSLRAESVACTLGLSRAHLYRLFAQRGLSVAAHIREQRLSRSRALLRNAALSIGEIALYCGYSDLPAYGKAFKRRFNMTPSEWRNAGM